MFRISTYPIRCFWNQNIALKSFSTNALYKSQNISLASEHVKSYEDIPLVKGLPLIGTVKDWVSAQETYHKLLRSRFQQYGPIYREKVGVTNNAKEMVFTANVEDWEKVLRKAETNTDVLPRKGTWGTVAYSKSRGTPPFISDMEGPEYKRIKESVASLLKPKEIAKNITMLADVTDDFTALLESRMNEDGVVEDIREFVHMWTFECGGSIVFRARLGTMDQGIENKKSMEVFEASRTFFKLFGDIEMSLPHHKLLMSSLWRNYASSLDTLYVMTKEYFNKYGEYVTDKSCDLTDAERESVAMSVLVAASDTTAHTALWALIELSSNQEVQERIHTELTKQYDGGELSYKHLQLPYLRGFLKEVFRVRPILGMFNRILPGDLELSGYHVPGGTVVTMLFDAYDQDEWFTDSHAVKPERWDRRAKSSNTNSFAILPFGFGHRSCLGRRLAENELYLLIAKMVYKYKIYPVKDYDTAARNFFISPMGDVDIRLEKRF